MFLVPRVLMCWPVDSGGGSSFAVSPDTFALSAPVLRSSGDRHRRGYPFPASIPLPHQDSHSACECRPRPSPDAVGVDTQHHHLHASSYRTRQGQYLVVIVFNVLAACLGLRYVSDHLYFYLMHTIRSRAVPFDDADHHRLCVLCSGTDRVTLGVHDD